MKTRNGFVSNSSSSSFVCEICNRSEVIYDSDDSGETCCCENGHEICTKHLLKADSLTTEEMREKLIANAREWFSEEEIEERIKAVQEMDRATLKSELEDDSDNYEVSEKLCPLCSFKTLTDDDLMDYLLMLVGSTKKNVIQQALTNYSSYDEFCKVIKQHKKAMKGVK